PIDLQCIAALRPLALFRMRIRKGFPLRTTANASPQPESTSEKRKRKRGTMKRLILAVLALMTAAYAQQPEPCLKLSQVKVDHQVLHQSATTDVKLKFEAKDYCVLTETPDLGRQMPVIELQSGSEINTKVRMVGAMRLDQSTISESVLKAKE